MSAEIVALPGVTVSDAPADAKPQRDVIDRLERLLAQARSGELQAVAVAAVTCRGAVRHCWADSEATFTQLMGAVTFLQVRYAQTFMGSMVPVDCDDEADEPA